MSTAEKGSARGAAQDTTRRVPLGYGSPSSSDRLQSELDHAELEPHRLAEAGAAELERRGQRRETVAGLCGGQEVGQRRAEPVVGGGHAGRVVVRRVQQEQRQLGDEAQRDGAGPAVAAGDMGHLHRRQEKLGGGFRVAGLLEVGAHGGALGRALEAGAVVAEALVAASVVVVEAEAGGAGGLAESRLQRREALGVCVCPVPFHEQQRAFAEGHAVQAGVERERAVVEQKAAHGGVLGPHHGVAELHVAAGLLAQAVPQKGAERVEIVAFVPPIGPRPVDSLGVGVGVGDDVEGEALQERLEAAVRLQPIAAREAFDDKRAQRLRPHRLVGVGAGDEARAARAITERDAQNRPSLLAVPDHAARGEVGVLGTGRLDLGVGLFGKTEARALRDEIGQTHSGEKSG